MSEGCNVLIVRTGIANLASVLAGLKRAGAEPWLSEDPAAVENAARVVLPGVGAFGAGMEQLRRSGLVEVLRERLRARRPTLAVCLGLQLLFAASEESPGIEGLAVFPDTIRRFSPSVRVPQLGWNKVLPQAGCSLLEGGYAYFANSFRAETIPQGWQGAFAEHGTRFVAALESGSVLCCQFHPELSGNWGAALLKRWLSKTSETQR